MNLIPVAIANQVARSTLHLQKSSPQILFFGGVVGVVSSTVLACRATLKAEEVLQTHQERMLLVNSMVDEPEYSDHDHRKDVTIVYTKTAMEMVKLYAPAIVIGAAALAALTTSNRMLTRRNAALGAAYTALDKGFRQYRERVIEKYGQEVDDQLRYGSETVEVKDEKTGRKKNVERVGPNGASIYAKFFDPTNPNWSRDPDYNLVFLKCQQTYANERLVSRGFLLLNEVYASLGMEQTTAGAIVGWTLNRNGDNFVSFGVFDQHSQEVHDFVLGREGSILLDFNVDGVVYDKIDEVGKEQAWLLGR